CNRAPKRPPRARTRGSRAPNPGPRARRARPGGPQRSPSAHGRTSGAFKQKPNDRTRFSVAVNGVRTSTNHAARSGGLAAGVAADAAEDGLDVVAVGVQDERRVVGDAIFGSEPGSAVVGAAAV